MLAYLPRRVVQLGILTGTMATAIGLAVAPATAAAPPITFAPAAFYPTGQQFAPPSVDENGTANGDFNGDGKLDVVSVAQAWGNSIVIQNGNGDGTFQTPGTVITITGGLLAENVVAGKFSPSGHTDIVALTSYGFFVFKNNGGGNFTQSALTTLSQAPFQDSAVATDANTDGKLDLVIKTNLGIQTELGNGDSTFTKGPFGAIPGSLPPAVSSIAVANTNGDNIPDLFAADAGTQQIFALKGVGDGSFTKTGSGITPLVPGGVLAVKNSANGLDSAVAIREFNIPGTSAALFPNNGTGGFKPSTPYNGGLNPAGGASGDFNGDGFGDVTISDTTGSKQNILAGDGNDAMSVQTAYSTGLSPQTPTVGDFNGDGKKDIAVTTICPKLDQLITGKTCLAVLINQS